MGFLTDLKIRTTPSRAREYLLADGDGLYLRVRATGKSWLYRYKSGNKQLKIGLGAYPTVTLAMARAWLKSASKDREWSAGYKKKVTRHLEIHVFPWVGDKMMTSIKPTEIVRCLHRIKDRGHLEMAQRVRETVQHVYQYAVDTGVLEPAQNFVNQNTGGATRSPQSPLRGHYRPQIAGTTAARHSWLQRQFHHDRRTAPGSARVSAPWPDPPQPLGRY